MYFDLKLKQLDRYLAINMVPREQLQIVALPLKSSTLGRVMRVDMAPLEPFRQFWVQGNPDENQVWQVLSEQYINKPYLDIPRFMRGGYDLKHEDFTVHHRNHDVTHAVRQRHYAKLYLNTIDTYGNAEFSPIAKWVKANPEVQNCLELAIFLCRSGRTNEKSGKDDPNNAKRSAELFATVAKKMGFNEGLVDFLKFAIGTHAPNLDKVPELLANLPGEHQLSLAKLLKDIIDLSHHTDLVRCKIGPPKEPVREQIDHELSELLDPQKINIHRVTTNFLLHATEACKVTGTRVKFQTFSQQDKNNTPYLKARYTKNVASCFAQLDQIPLDLHRIAHEGPVGDFAELLRKVPITGVLDLTNKHIDLVQLEQIKQTIAHANLNKASLLGIKPAAMQKELMDVLLEKSRLQKAVGGADIEVSHSESLEDKLTSDFNKQFIQQALSQQKVSMRFEPSRLAAAFSKGIGAFFSQLLKEIKGDIPKFGGETHFGEISGVSKLSNPAIEARYAEAKAGRSIDPLAHSFMRELQTIQTEDIQLEPGEMLLYHGTRLETTALIMKDGFNEDRCRYVPGNGYGPLGKGVYFTSELAKAATFSTCSVCGQSGQCMCVDPNEDFRPADRVVLLCKVFVGQPETILRKGDIKERTKAATGFDSCIAVSNQLDPISDFRSTEVCIPSGRQVIPLYEIRFNSQPNLLRVAEWQKMTMKNGLDTIPRVKPWLQVLTNYLTELQKLRAASAPFLLIKGCVEKTERALDVIMTSLSKQHNELQARKPHTEKEDKAFQAMTRQLGDLNSMKRQLSLFKTRDEHVHAKPKNQSIASADLSLPRTKSLVSRVGRFFLPKEYQLKKDSREIASKIQHSPGSPEKFLVHLSQWLNLAIERDQRKGTTFKWFGTRTYPTHRLLLTQKMINLRDFIRDLEDKKLPQDELQVQIQGLLADVVKTLGECGKREPKLLAATGYNDICIFTTMVDQWMMAKPDAMNPILQSLSGGVDEAATTAKEIESATPPIKLQMPSAEGDRAQETNTEKDTNSETDDEADNDSESYAGPKGP